MFLIADVFGMVLVTSVVSTNTGKVRTILLDLVCSISARRLAFRLV